MNKYSVFNDPWFIGFDKFWNQTANTNSGFPFYNIVKIDKDTFGIELALAGFNQKDIELEERNSSLIIRGEKKDDERDYIHKGIAAKKFSRSFMLAEHVHVASAKMDNGMLQIILKREIPESEKPKKIAIEA